MVARNVDVTSIIAGEYAENEIRKEAIRVLPVRNGGDLVRWLKRHERLVTGRNERATFPPLQFGVCIPEYEHRVFLVIGGRLNQEPSAVNNLA